MDVTSILAYIIAPIASGIVTIFGTIIAMRERSIMSRIEKLEEQTAYIKSQAMSQADVRQILQDKLEPLQDDLKEIKNTQQRLLDIAMKK